MVDDPIELYLDELLVQLRGAPRFVRRALVEAESHLRDDVANGATASEAIDRFGDPHNVAALWNAQGGVSVGVLARQLIVASSLLCAIGFLAIGLSGAISGVMDAAYGPTFVAGDLPTVTYTAERCAEYEVLAPNESTCLSAAARHHSNEIEATRIGAGAIGAIGLGIWYVLRRRWRTTPATGALPRALVPGVGAAVFGVATLALATEAMQAISWRSTSGLGQWLSAGMVSALVTAGFTVALIRQLRRPDAQAIGT